MCECLLIFVWASSYCVRSLLWRCKGLYLSNLCKTHILLLKSPFIQLAKHISWFIPTDQCWTLNAGLPLYHFQHALCAFTPKSSWFLYGLSSSISQSQFCRLSGWKLVWRLSPSMDLITTLKALSIFWDCFIHCNKIIFTGSFLWILHNAFLVWILQEKPT